MAVDEYDSADVKNNDDATKPDESTGTSKDFAGFDNEGGVVIDGTTVTFVGDLTDIVAMVKATLNDDRYDEIIPLYTRIAAVFVINRLYPMDKTRTWADVPARYAANVVMIAVHLINKRGAEGETQHEENGTKRVYSSSEIPAGMLSDIVPFASVPQ